MLARLLVCSLAYSFIRSLVRSLAHTLFSSSARYPSSIVPSARCRSRCTAGYSFRSCALAGIPHRQKQRYSSPPPFQHSLGHRVLLSRVYATTRLLRLFLLILVSLLPIESLPPSSLLPFPYLSSSLSPYVSPIVAPSSLTLIAGSLRFILRRDSSLNRRFSLLPR